MTFQIEHTKPSLLRRHFFKILFLIGVLIFVLVFGFVNSVRTLTIDLFVPFFRFGGYFHQNIGQIPKFFTDKTNLITENTNLINEIENLRLDIADYESVKSENQRLRQTLEIKPTGEMIIAVVIAKSPQIPLDSLLLDKGFFDSLADGYLVLASERVLLGKLVKVSQNSATVVLNSSAGVISYGFVDRTDEPLEIKGVGGGSIEAKIPIDFDIEVGDKIMTAHSRALLMAVVGSVEKDASSGFKNVLLSLPADVAKVNTVFVEPVIN